MDFCFYTSREFLAQNILLPLMQKLVQYKMKYDQKTHVQIHLKCFTNANYFLGTPKFSGTNALTLTPVPWSDTFATPASVHLRASTD